MLAIKIVLVPLFLLALSLASRYWGPSVAGRLAGLPVVAGPILLFLAIDQGSAFAASSASAALSAVLASVTFSVAYAHAARHSRWPLALVVGLAAWCVAAFMLSQLPSKPSMALVVALGTLAIGPRFFPSTHAQARPAPRRLSSAELSARMIAGALLTLTVTFGSAHLGGKWSGLLAVFPVLGIVLATFSHRAEGPHFATALLRGMTVGLYSFVSFCFVLAIALPVSNLALGFVLASVVSVGVQATTMRVIGRGVRLVKAGCQQCPVQLEPCSKSGQHPDFFEPCGPLHGVAGRRRRVHAPNDI